MKIKYLSRKNWSRILRSDAAFCEKHLLQMHFVSSLYRIHKVREPLVLPACGQPLCMADDGYAWLHVLPENENWCLTVMYDAAGAPVQYYFDISQDNTLDGEKSHFTDLYLDIVCLPDGRTEIIDQSDLDDALKKGEIVQAQYDVAQGTANELQKQVTARFGALTAFCQSLYNELNI